ncbi:MAG: histidine phosphatase family protein [Actinomycetota bacterium]
MATLLLLIRHGLTDTAGKRLSGHARGVDLNQRGREQAVRLVERLAPVPVLAIYSSSLERCVQTAAPLAEARGLEIHRLDSLRDVDYGGWTNRNIAQVRKTKLWLRLMAAPADARFPGGETTREVQSRIVGEVASIVGRHPRAAIAVFSHADPIKLVLAHYLGVHLDLYPRIVVNPASISAVAAGDGVPRVLKVNDTGGLVDIAPPRPRKAGR